MALTGELTYIKAHLQFFGKTLLYSRSFSLDKIRSKTCGQKLIKGMLLVGIIIWVKLIAHFL